MFIVSKFIVFLLYFSFIIHIIRFIAITAIPLSLGFAMHLYLSSKIPHSTIHILEIVGDIKNITR